MSHYLPPLPDAAHGGDIRTDDLPRLAEAGRRLVDGTASDAELLLIAQNFPAVCEELYQWRKRAELVVDVMTAGNVTFLPGKAA